MKFQEADKSNWMQFEAKPRTKGVILITDNRPKNNFDKSVLPDFRQSGFKQTDIDPLQVWAEINAQHQQDSIIQELNRRLINLQERVKKLQKSGQRSQVFNRVVSEQKDKKHRRKFSELNRKYQCHFQDCEKIYGSQTSLKHHLKIKHKYIKIKEESKENIHNNIMEEKNIKKQ